MGRVTPSAHGLGAAVVAAGVVIARIGTRNAVTAGAMLIGAGLGLVVSQTAADTADCLSKRTR